MSYVKKNLNQGEHIISVAKRSNLLLRGRIILTFFWVALSIAAYVFTKKYITFVIAGVALISFVVEFIKFKRNTLTLTNNRIIFRVGVFNTTSVDVFYEQIDTVTIKQNLRGKIFHFSDIWISTGNSSSVKGLSGVVDGDKLKNIIMQQVEERKKAAAEEQARLQAKAMCDAFVAMREAFATMQTADANNNVDISKIADISNIVDINNIADV